MKELIAIVTCHADKYRERANAQRQTWVQHAESCGFDVKFFLGQPPANETAAADEIFLDVDDSYKGMPAKVQAAFRWVYAANYEYVFKTDDDVYINMLALKKAPHDPYDFVGNFRGATGGYPAMYASGFGYWLSRRAMLLIAEAAFTDDWAEDRWVANALAKAGVQGYSDGHNYRASYPPSLPAQVFSGGLRNAAVFCEYPPDLMRKMYQCHGQNRTADCAKVVLKAVPLPNDVQPVTPKDNPPESGANDATKSIDFYDTLVARRSITDAHKTGVDEVANLIPICENIRRVNPHDIIISDYYDERTVLLGLRDVCKLANRAHVSEDDKRTGKAWELFRPALHIGDNPATDIESPRRAGIPAELTMLSAFTTNENWLNEEGFKGLARTMREARLATYNAEYRALELLQTQVNFPLLFVASILLHRRLVSGNYKRVLMSSRDCFLWEQLQHRVRDWYGPSNYEVEYFYTSRIARTFPSASYLRYVNDRINSAMVVDLCGYGLSLQKLLAKTVASAAPILLLVKYPHPARTRAASLLTAENSYIERVNMARHPMVVDVTEGGEPVYENPHGIDWENEPRIKVMHDVFFAAMHAMARYDFISDRRVPDGQMLAVAKKLNDQLPEYMPRLEFASDILYKEEPGILQRLNGAVSQAARPTPASQPTSFDSGALVAVRMHCEMPYFGQCAVMDGLMPEIIQTLKVNKRAAVAANSTKMARDIASLTGGVSYYLPSVHTLVAPRTDWQEDPQYDDVACFGRIFSLKNLLTQAAAALEFSRTRGKRLRFHVSDLTDGADGKDTLKVLQMLFAGRSDAALLVHRWMPRAVLAELLADMTIGLQCTLSEASNVTSVDMVGAGVPIVVSREVKWAHSDSLAYPTDSARICKTMLHAVAHPELVAANRERIVKHNEACWQPWGEFLQGVDKPKVLLFGLAASVDTGIMTVAQADAAMLRSHGVDAECVRTNFTAAAILQVARAKKPTHIISEASWLPLAMLGKGQL